MSPDAVWWESRARIRYRQWQEAKAVIDRVRIALEVHGGGSDLEREIRRALDSTS